METVYLKRAWAALTAEQGWWKPVLILALVQIIPVIGQIVAFGYLFQWAREAAWGIERGLPRNTGKLNQAFKTGLIAFLTIVCWVIVLSFLHGLLKDIPMTGDLLAFMFIPFGFVSGMFVLVMIMRAVIYDAVAPLFQFQQAWEMVIAKPRGLLRVFGIYCLAVLATMLITPTIGTILTINLFANYGWLAILLVVVGMIPLTYLCSTVFFVLLALALRSLGYWTGEFEPAKWGTSQDGLPNKGAPRTGHVEGAGTASAPGSRGDQA